MDLKKEGFLKNKIVVGVLGVFVVLVLILVSVLAYMYFTKPEVEIGFVKTKEVYLPERINTNTGDFLIKSENATLKINDQDYGVFTEYKTKSEDFKEGENLVEVQEFLETPFGTFRYAKFSEIIEVDRVSPEVEVVSYPKFLLDPEKEGSLVFKSEEGITAFLNEESLEPNFEEEQYLTALNFEKGFNKFVLKVVDSFGNATEKEFEVEVFNAEGYEILDCYGAKIPFNANKYQVGYSGLSPSISFNVGEAREYVKNSQSRECDFDESDGNYFNSRLTLLPKGTILPCYNCGFSPTNFMYVSNPSEFEGGAYTSVSAEEGVFKTKQGKELKMIEANTSNQDFGYSSYSVEIIFDYNNRMTAVGGEVFEFTGSPTQAEKDSLKAEVQEMASNLYLE